MLHDFDIKPYDKEDYIFIAGTPRSGTQYIADVFQQAGVDVQHEVFGDQGISAFFIVPHLVQREKGIILHQVRDPIKTIASMQTISRSWHYITEYTGISPECGGKIYAAMRLYLRLNAAIEKYAHYRYKIEEIDTEWPKLISLLGLSDIPLPDVPRDTHTRADEYKPLSWHELEFRHAEITKYISEMGHKYGY